MRHRTRGLLPMALYKKQQQAPPRHARRTQPHCSFSLLTLPGSCSFSHAPPVSLTLFSSLCLLFTTAISFPLLRSSPCQSSLTSPFPSLPRSHSAIPSCLEISGLGLFSLFSDLHLYSNSHYHPHFIPTLDSRTSHSVHFLAAVLPQCH